MSNDLRRSEQAASRAIHQPRFCTYFACHADESNEPCPYFCNPEFAPLSTSNEVMTLERLVNEFAIDCHNAYALDSRNVDDFVAAITSTREAELRAMEVSLLDWGSWLKEQCDLHEKYTSACCGCQKARHALHTIEDYQEWQKERADQYISKSKGGSSDE